MYSNRTSTIKNFLLLIAVLPCVFTNTCEPEHRAAKACPHGWTATSDPMFCLKFSSTRRTWSDARAQCQEEGADLIRAYFGKMITGILKFIKIETKQRRSWIGLTKNQSEWTWASEPAQIQFSNWQKREPTQGVQCATVYMGLPLWKGADCDNRRIYFCEIPRPVSGCPEGWNDLGLSPWCVKDYYKKETYQSAESMCSSLNATIVTIKSRQKNSGLKKYWNSLAKVWIGATDKAKEGRFVWATGGKLSFTGGLYDSERTKDCVRVYVKAEFTGWRWKEEDCSEKLTYICQKSSDTAVSLPMIEMTPRLTKPAKINLSLKYIYFIGDTIKATCTALHVPSKKLDWSFERRKKVFYPSDWNQGAKYTNNSVVTISQGTSCVDQTVSTLTIPATIEFNKIHINCFSIREDTSAFCSGKGDPLEYCAKSNKIKVVEGPLESPKLEVEFPTPPSTVAEGSELAAYCIVYPNKVGSLVWVIYSDTESRTLMNHVDPEIVSEHSDVERGKVYTKSDLMLKVDTSLKRIACFAYDVRQAASLTCHKSDKFCAITPLIKVTSTETPGLSWHSFFIIIIVTAVVIVLLLCLGLYLWIFRTADTKRRSSGPSVRSLENFPGIEDNQDDEYNQDDEHNKDDEHIAE
ncbi:macrophage mannose receptor 1-like [Elysia marginata]|uniref:Macrophage mannose receptor 1-like n=1 Tax=Elysia marginata TaxID=1093978 RepID=A0AAV4HA55_9GAST|nr:macrophage mannose receptor 1-like [Elysia marginata]